MYYFEINQRVSVSQSRTVRYRFALVILIWVPEAIVDVVVRKGFNTGNEMLNRENLRLFLLGLLFTPTRLPYSMILILDIWVFFPSPTSQISDISWVSSNLAKIWCYLPGDRIRSHRLRLSPTGTPLAVQWLRLWAANAGGECWIPDWETKTPHASQLGQKTEKKKKGLVLQHCPPPCPSNVNCKSKLSPVPDWWGYKLHISTFPWLPLQAWWTG